MRHTLTYCLCLTLAFQPWLSDLAYGQGRRSRSIEYDQLGNVVETKTYVSQAAYEANEANYLTIAETLYDEFARPIVTTDTHTAGASGVPGTETVYDALGRVIRTKRWADVTIPIVDILDDSNNVIGRTNTLTDNNDPNWSRGVLLSTSKTSYNKAGRVWRTDTEDENGQDQATYYEYDAAGRQTAVINGLSHRTEYGYLGNRRTSITDALGHITQFKHDDLGRVKRTTYDDGTSTYSHYDELGRVFASNDQAGRTRGFEYKRDDWSSAVVLPAVANPEDGNNLAHPRYEYTCDKYGNVIEETTKLIQDPNTGDVDANYARTTYFTYDYLGNQLTRKLPNGKVEYKEYSALGQLTKATDFKGQIVRYEYNDPNAPGRLSKQKYYSSSVIAINDPNLVIEIVRDRLGRRIRIDVNDLDNVTLAKWRWWYDSQGRVTTLHSPQGFVAYEYNNNTGRQKSVRTPDLSADTKLDYYYDQLGRLSTVDVAKRNNVVPTSQELTSYAYNAVGSVDKVTCGNGNVTRYAYDALNRLIDLTNWQSDAQQTVLSRYEYTLNPDGQRASCSETTDAGTTEIAWTYDNLNRLTVEDNNDPNNANDYRDKYVYDLVGNRLERQILVGDGNDTSYYYNETDQLTREFTDANTHYSYDDNGSLISEANDSVTLRTYTYNLRNRLASFDDGSVTVAYLYNPDGMRVRSTVDGNDIDYIIDPYNPTGYAQVLKEINGITGTDTAYVTGLDVLAQAIGTNDPKYLLYDGHGSVRQVAGSAGTVTDNLSYDAYGVMRNQPQTLPTNMLYAGEMYDQHVGWYNNRSRWYNPTIGRFNRMDEFAGTNRDPQSLHKYLYAHCNPINNVDPSGERTLAEVLTVVGTVLTVGSLVSAIMPSLMRGLSSAQHLLELVDFANAVRSMANRGIIDPIVAEEIKAEATHAANELLQNVFASFIKVARQIIMHYAYGMAFAAVTRAAMGGVSAAVSLSKSAAIAVKIKLGNQVIRHHLVFRCALKKGIGQRLWRLPRRLHVGKPRGLHYRISQDRRFGRLQPRRGMPMRKILRKMGRQAWLDEVGEAYKWLETKWPNDYKGIHEAYEQAVKQIGGPTGLL